MKKRLFWSGALVSLLVSVIAAFLVWRAILPEWVAQAAALLWAAPIAFLATLPVVYFLSRFLAKNAADRINVMDPDRPAESCPYEELQPLARSMALNRADLERQLEILQDKRRETDAIIDAMTEGFVVLDVQLNILSINRSAARLFGTTSQEAVGKTLPAVNRQAEIMQLLLDLDKGQKGSVSFMRNGRTYEVTGSVIADSDRGIVLLISDLTDRVEGEKMRKRFTANVSHELRTPLTAICGYAELLSSGLVKDEDKNAVAGRIYAEGRRMLALVEDILKLSRMDEGYPGGRRETVYLKQLAQRNAEALEAMAGKKGVTIDVMGGELAVIGDETLLNEMLYNLMDNAIKYNRPGGHVAVSLKTDDDQVWLTVRDTGIGIEKSQQDKIFERFYRTDKSRSKTTGGTGLGLSIVKHSAEYHHAKLSVDSDLGRGTTMTVIFPKAPENAEDD